MSPSTPRSPCQPVFQPADPAYAERVRASFARQGFMREIGARIAALAPGACEIELDYHDRLSQQHGFFHGGIVGTLADNAGGYAAFTLMPADASILTVEYKVSLLAPAAGERLISRGTVVRAGNTLTVSRSSVYVRKGGNERLCAEGLVTLMALHGQLDAPPGASG
jgi:uncharacterized protein (TIGR00369 family)